MTAVKGLSLLSGGLDSQLAVKVLESAGAEVEGVCFATPFFSHSAAEKAAEALGIRLHIVDFTATELALIENPPHGFGKAMNPCIDCHAGMIRCAGEMAARLGFDFVATGEVLGQRPMSQNRQALGIVEREAALQGRLVRPLSALLLEPSIPELEGRLDRSKLLSLQGRRRDAQIALAAQFGITEYPSPAGGCKLTEAAYGRKLKDLRDHEGLGSRRLVELLAVGRHFRLPDGTGLIVGRDQRENEILACETALGEFFDSGNLPGPGALLVGGARSADDLALARRIVAAYTKGGGEASRDFMQPYHIC